MKPFLKKIISKDLLVVYSVFLSGLIIRLIFIAFGNHPDILSLAGWGKWIYQNGTMGFYENQIWIYSSPTQAPLFNLVIVAAYAGYEGTLNLLRWLTFNVVPHLAPGHMLWWFDGVWWWERTLFSPTSFLYGFIMWIKIPPIIADLVIALIIFLIGKKHTNRAKALLMAGLFLLMPFSWYLSALWGQYDQLVALLVLISFLALYKRFFFLSVLTLLIAGQLKATAAFFIPFYVFYYFYQRPGLKDILLSAVVSFGAFWLMTAPFSDRNPLLYTYEVIYPKMFFSDRWMIANHVFNLWQFIYPLGGWSKFTILGIPAFIWSFIFMMCVYIVSFAVMLQERSLKNLLISLYVVATGIYMFGNGMLDRYFFPSLLFLALLTFFYPKLLKFWIITSFLFLINLFYSWGFPFLEVSQVWKNDILIRILSLINMVIFFVCLYLMGVFNTVKEFFQRIFKTRTFS